MTPLAARPTFVVDTSVAVKWVVEREEAAQTQALRLLESHLKGRCLLRAPELLMFEVANALARGRKQAAALVNESLSYFYGLGLRLETLYGGTLAKAVEIAEVTGATVYDAYFLAMALESESILVTDDQNFLRRVSGYPNIKSLRQLHLPS